LHDIPESQQSLWGVQAEEKVTFTQLSLHAYQPRDAIRFRNGREVLLGELREGQRVKVLALALAEPEAVEQEAGARALVR
jgi:hypothetical protein